MRETCRGVVETNLINEEHIGCSVPAPFPSHCVVLVDTLLNYFTWSVSSKEAKHGAGSRPAIEPYGQAVSALASFNEPKEEICRIGPGQVYPTRILLLLTESCFARALRLLVGNSNVAVSR